MENRHRYYKRPQEAIGQSADSIAELRWRSQPAIVAKRKTLPSGDPRNRGQSKISNRLCSSPDGHGLRLPRRGEYSGPRFTQG